jgi:hypothetical protein
MQLLAKMCSHLSTLHSSAAAGDGASVSRLQAVAFEALAAVPAAAAAISYTLSPGEGGGRSQAGTADVAAVDQHCAALSQLLLSAHNAGQAARPSPRHLAAWAAAVDAGLRLLPALFAQGSRESVRGAFEVFVRQFWKQGGHAAYRWAHPPDAASRASGSAAGEAWAAAAPALAAAHARACRMVHWLRAQPDDGASVLSRLMPQERLVRF